MTEDANIGMQLPPGRLTLPQRGEDHVAVMTRDWKRLRSRIDSVSNSRREFSAIAWAAVGAAVSALFAALAWYPTYSALPKDQRLHYGWIGPVTIVTGLAATVIAALMFYAAHKAQSTVETTVAELLLDMDEMPLTPVQ